MKPARDISCLYLFLFSDRVYVFLMVSASASNVHEQKIFFLPFFLLSIKIFRGKNVLGQMMREIIGHLTSTKGCHMKGHWCSGLTLDTTHLLAPWT